ASFRRARIKARLDHARAPADNAADHTLALFATSPKRRLSTPFREPVLAGYDRRIVFEVRRSGAQRLFERGRLRGDDREIVETIAERQHWLARGLHGPFGAVELPHANPALQDRVRSPRIADDGRDVGARPR